MSTSKLLLIAVSLVSTMFAQAQSRNDVANFSLFQQYYNPALTGFKGSMLKTYYRDQWSAFENAPQTFFVSGELNLQSLKNKASVDSMEMIPVGVRHSAGISYLHDTFGPLIEGQLFVNYASSVQLTEDLGLRAGGAITYNAQRIDGNKITFNQQDDPSMVEFMNSNMSSNRIDFNLGLVLSGENFYAGYAMQDVAKGGFIAGYDFLRKVRSRLHIVQAGYRRAVTQDVGIIANGLLRYDTDLGETIEGQLKGIFYNTGWVGVGYRHELAYSIQVGFRFQQFSLGYVRELPIERAANISSGTSEFVMTYNFISVPFEKNSRKMTMW